MRWEVQGVLANNQRVRLRITAPDRDAVMAKAAEKGINVTSVVAHVPEIAEEPPAALAPVEVIAGPATDAAVNSVPYAAAGTVPTVPHYGGIITGAGVLSILGLIAYVVAAIAGFSALAVFASTFEESSSAGLGRLPHNSSPFAYVSMIPLLMFSVGCLFWGAMCRLIAACALALRDMARNSFTANQSAALTVEGLSNLSQHTHYLSQVAEIMANARQHEQHRGHPTAVGRRG